MHQNVLSVKAKKLDLLVIGDFRQKRRACFWKGEQLLVLQICTCNLCFLLSIWRDKAVPLVFTNLAMSIMWWGLCQARRVLPPPLCACPWCGNPSSHDFLFQIRTQTYFLSLHVYLQINISNSTGVELTQLWVKSSRIYIRLCTLLVATPKHQNTFVVRLGKVERNQRHWREEVACQVRPVNLISIAFLKITMP